MNIDPPISEIILQGEIVSCQLTPAGSNYTFLARVQLGDRTTLAIYKPRDGESPLWDFPSGTLYIREYAAYILSQELGWGFIPFTAIRDGPYGIGTLQQYVEHDPSQNYYSLTAKNAAQLRAIACFDLVANSTDRKPNHLFTDKDGRLWSIDHGLTFHADTKIRTVIWDFCGQPIPKPLLDDVARLSERLRNPEGRVREILALLSPQEVTALMSRVEWVLAERVFPGLPGGHRPYR